MRITITVDSDSDGPTPMTVDNGPSRTEGVDAVDTGPASTSGQTASATASAVFVGSPSTDGPPAFLPEPAAPPDAPEAGPGDLSAGPAPGVADILSGNADPGTIGGTR
ncbi:MAG: hypothetical protein ABR608_08705 [Pseudonocardiaceae bacterium]